MANRLSDEQAELEMRKALKEFRMSATRISELWNQCDGQFIDRKLNAGYPFENSFDEVVIEIGLWTDELI